MKKLFKFIFLGLFIGLLSVSCGSNSGNKDKNEADSTSVKILKKNKVEEEPESGCD